MLYSAVRLRTALLLPVSTRPVLYSAVRLRTALLLPESTRPVLYSAVRLCTVLLLSLYRITTVSLTGFVLCLYCINTVFVLYHYCIGLLIVCTVLVLYHNGVYALLNHLWFWSLYRSSPLVLHRCCRCIRIRLVLLGSRRRHFIYLYTARRRLKVERWPKSTTSCRSETSNISLVV